MYHVTGGRGAYSNTIIPPFWYEAVAGNLNVYIQEETKSLNSDAQSMLPITKNSNNTKMAYFARH